MPKKATKRLTKEEKAALSRHAKPRGGVRKSKLWQPSDRDLQWYTDTMIRGMPYQQVADQVGITRQTVWGAVKKVETWLEQQHRPTVMEHRDLQTRQLRFIYAEAIRAWERSCGVTEIVTTKEHPLEEATAANSETGVEVLMTLIERTTRSEKQVGDPRFLELALKVMRDVRDIWGVDKPTEVVVHTTPYDDLLPVGGKSRLQAKQDQLEAELARVKSMKAEQEKQTSHE